MEFFKYHLPYSLAAIIIFSLAFVFGLPLPAIGSPAAYVLLAAVVGVVVALSIRADKRATQAEEKE